ncbi:ABC transporter ATP-binding protein [Mycobacterium deserti]|uniref:ABC transporter ATP-binding protein/permease n=1 Tax=Mycobacterium deserti TaxID=2978347 RepID=A0ABT2MCJ5_9MYCO|nr:ABC transporter ATP-binding protein [Mycobacterium deserti]MCT7659992.1 ABC transporter ATP-binding protein/permease [Mycobacterium deserti]
MTVSLLLLAVATVLIMLQPLLAGRLVDRAADGAPSAAWVMSLLAMLVGQLVLEALAQFRLDRTGERVVLQSRAVFTTHVVHLPIGVLDASRTGGLLARGTSDASLLRDMPRAVGDLVFGSLTLLGAGIIMLSIDAITVGVVVVVMAVAFGAGSPLLSRIQHASMKRQAALGDYTAGLDRTLGAARTVKLFGAEDREVKSISTGAHAAYEAGVRIASATAGNRLLVRLGVTGAFLAIMIIDGRRVTSGELSVGQFVSMFAFAMYAVFPITAGFSALATLRTSAGAYHHLVAVLRELPEDDASRLDSEPAPVASRSAGRPAPLVEFEHVSFSYGDNAVLSDVSLRLNRNQVTALIGPSGAGKSTILGLLCRFHDPATGTVRWDGQDIRSMSLKDLRGKLGLLEQDAPVLNGTIRDNLLIADPGATDSDLWRVLAQANIVDEIAMMPAQLDTPVLERGRSLSGGQRQRLALARAYLSKSELILMDEPTAHLDRANEYDVMANLLEARGQRSLLVVAHRLSTVTSADQILVLSHGRIQAAGTHKELLRLPIYRELIEHELADR